MLTSGEVVPSIQETIRAIESASSWDKRVAEIRLIPENHGNSEHEGVYAGLARALYVPHLSPDFAYIHNAPFYEKVHFEVVYAVAHEETGGFTKTSEEDLLRVIKKDSRTLLVFRTITGLLKDEFAHSTGLIAQPLGLDPLGKSTLDSMERSGMKASDDVALVVARTLTQIIDGTLFGRMSGDPHSKLAKPDTMNGWQDIQAYAARGVPYGIFLHQRHYGGSFSQISNATSTKRGNILEDAVETLFVSKGIPYIRTGAHNQGEIVKRFNVTVTPAPDFVVFDNSENLRGLLECKAINDGGTARDKAMRFKTLREESIRLGGVPLVAVLAGMGWTRVTDALGPVIRDTDGRVFALSNLNEMLLVAPFPSLIGMASA